MERISNSPRLWHKGHTGVSKLASISSDNGLSPDWHQAIIWTNAGILLIGLQLFFYRYSYLFIKRHEPSEKKNIFCGPVILYIYGILASQTEANNKQQGK